MPLYPIVNLDHISFIRNGKAILQNISLRIETGQHWVIIGQNGSGKTSLISIIDGYHQPSEGKAWVLGKKFGSTDLRELRLKIGECSSEIRDMIHNWETVMDIVLSGRFASIGLYEKPDPKDHEHAAYLLDSLGMSDMAGRRFNTLSDGEKQKTLLARALMPEPELLVLDEPCAGLDLKAREELLDAVQEMCTERNGPTLIYITHHIEEIIPSITHVLTLRNGRVIASGKREDVLTNAVLSETFEVPIELHDREGRLWPMIMKS
ncbi:MAG: ABC transporter ATP-binding protein [Candidatus Methanoperedens sp.]|nr:ABC transporter ATP-binding protein [Candidatus Methanoperedens sp.]CAG0990292.1 putative ABC transporter ATP-binding protein YlmA [Methanosarcinales archaeon]